MFVVLMLVQCRERLTNKKKLVKMKIKPTGRSASKITDVRNPPVLSVKDSLHCIQRIKQRESFVTLGLGLTALPYMI